MYTVEARVVYKIHIESASSLDNKLFLQEEHKEQQSLNKPKISSSKCWN